MKADSPCLQGRTAEESILLNSYFASLSLDSNSSASVILVQGECGVGKSKFAESLRSHVSQDDGYFIRGKFDQMSYHDETTSSFKSCVTPPLAPYSGIASAFAQYCNALEKRGAPAWDTVVKLLQHEIGTEEARHLYEAFPALKRIFVRESNILQLNEQVSNKPILNTYMPARNRGNKSTSKLQRRHSREDNVPPIRSSGGRNDYTESGSQRLNYVLKKFIQAISSVGDPIVILIDDVQWADSSSLELLRTLIVGAKSPIIFIFTFRPIKSSHPFHQMMKDLKNIRISKTEIHLRNLREGSVRDLVANILSIDSRKGVPIEMANDAQSRVSETANESNLDSASLANLSSTICKITDGNPLFVRQQINFWIDQGLISPSENHRWTWDIEKIKQSNVLGDVVSMISEKIRTLSTLTQSALKIFACMGSTVELHILGLLVRETCSSADALENDAIATNAISQALQEMLVVYTAADEMAVSFVHDSIQTAAYSLLDTHSQANFHLQIGLILCNNLAPELFEKSLFTIANQLARGYKLITNRDERIDSASIFLRAGDKAAAASAFPEAAFFYGRGICMINDGEDWIKNYRLCMDCYLKGAEAAAIADDYDQMYEWIDVIFSRCNGLDDEFQAHYIHVRSLAQRNEMERAVDVGLEALTLIGIHIPSRRVKAHTLVELVKTRNTMKHISTEELLLLPPTKDRQLPSLRLLNLLCILSLSGKKHLCPLICFKAVQLNLKHGLLSGMPICLANYGFLLSRFGMLQDAVKYCEMSSTVQGHLGTMEAIASVTLVSYGVVFPFTKRLVECAKRLGYGYKAGIETGDVAHSLRCAAVYTYISFFSGQPLETFMNGAQASSKTMQDHNSNSTLLVNYIYQQTAANFLGCRESSSNPAYLKGKYFDFDAVERQFQQKNFSVMQEHAGMLQTIVAYFFAHYEVGWKASEKIIESGGSTLTGFIFQYIHAFYRGLTAIALARNGAKKRYFLGVAKSCIKELKVGRKKSPLNLTHQSYLLQAELAVTRKKYDQAEKMFYLSICHANLTGILYEQALIHERFGFYYIIRSNHEAAYQQIRAARDLYAKWGSRAKIGFLNKRFPHLREKQRDHKEILERRRHSSESTLTITH